MVNSGKVEKAAFTFYGIARTFCDVCSDPTTVNILLILEKLLGSSTPFSFICFIINNNFKSLMFRHTLVSLGTSLPLCWELGLILIFSDVLIDGLRFHFSSGGWIERGYRCGHFCWCFFSGNSFEVVILVGVGFNDLFRRGGASV